MERPESTRNTKERTVREEIVPAEPAASTISQENISTTPVRRAVATSESVERIPHLARMAVIPANRADKNAMGSQNIRIASDSWE